MPRHDQDHATRSVQKFAVRMQERPTLADRLLDLIAKVPEPRESVAPNPAERARHLSRIAATKSAATAGVLALPPGALGWATITPELYAVWKIQAQLVSDIAGAYGKRELLGREQMLYCMFGHTAAGAFEDIVVRIGQRYLIRRTPVSGLYAVGNKIAMLIAQRSAGRMVTRWLPAVGALGVAGFVYVDTGKVADTAIDLFEHDVVVEDAKTIVTAASAAAGSAAPVKKAARAPVKKAVKTATKSQRVVAAKTAVPAKTARTSTARSPRTRKPAAS